MKKKTLGKKLELRKETISSLNDEQMSNVKGGNMLILSLGKKCHSNNNPGDCETVTGDCTGCRPK